MHESLRHPLLALAVLGPIGMEQRTAFFDRAVVDALDEGIEQFVVLGAGYDGRALRFGVPGTRWIEVDHPATQADKRRLVSATGASAGHVTFAGVDLVADDLDAALADAGHRRDDRTLFMAEGLLTYLPLPAIHRLLGVLRHRAATGSVLALNVRVELENRRHHFAAPVDALLRVLGERRQSRFLLGDIERILGEAGWSTDRSDSSPPHPVDGSSLQVLTAVAR